MKRKCLNRILSILLVAAMVLSLGPTVLAAQEQRVPFRQVEADAPLEREPADIPQDTSYAPTDLVRVSIVLEDRPGLEQMEASSGLSTAALAVSPQMQQTRQSLEANQAALARRISNQVLGGEPLDVVWNLTLAANLISANVQYEQIEAIQAVPGVKEVILETRYEPAVYSQGTADPSMATSGEMIGTSAAYAAGYTGAGMRIAVIDTGTDTDHKSFDADAFAYALAEDEKASGEAYDLLDAAEIGAVLPQLNAYKRTLQNGKPTAATPTAEQLYGTAKLPFHYNYVDGDLDVTHDNDEQGEHGSHVAGITSAGDYIPTKDASIYDFDGDGDLDQADAQALMDHVVKGSEIHSAEYADLSGNGSVSAYDVHLLLDQLEGYEEDGTLYVSAAQAVGVTGVAPDAQLK